MTAGSDLDREQARERGELAGQPALADVVFVVPGERLGRWPPRPVRSRQWPSIRSPVCREGSIRAAITREWPDTMISTGGRPD